MGGEPTDSGWKKWYKAAQRRGQLYSACQAHVGFLVACAAARLLNMLGHRIGGLAAHRSVHVGQAEVAAGVAVGELFVVEAQQVQDRGVQVVDVDRVFDGR